MFAVRGMGAFLEEETRLTDSGASVVTRVKRYESTQVKNVQLTRVNSQERRIGRARIIWGRIEYSPEHN